MSDAFYKKKIIFEKPNYTKLINQGYVCVDMHYHSTFSDGAATINEIVKKLKDLKIGISLTDHNEIKGVFELNKVIEKNNLFLVPGIEVKSQENIDILFYFYNISELKKFFEQEIIKNRINYFHSTKTKINLVKLLKLKDNYKCITSVAHPYGYNLRAKKNLFNEFREILLKFPNIEVINGGNNREDNIKAINLARKNKKGFTSGSDGHSIYSLGKTITCAKAKNLKEFLDSIKNKKNFVIGTETDFGKYGEYIRFGFNKIKNLF
ncbi:MAG: PHP domain-containing protein [Candidatus Woesearchaeota archaeon]